MLIAAWLAFAAAAVPAVLTWLNVGLLRVPPRSRSSRRRVSVLIPARDEADDIATAVDSALASLGVELEVIVFDDDSADDTARIVEARACRDRRLRLVRGGPLGARGWGKPLACAQLAAAARGDVLVFMDADVRLAEDALARLAAELERSNAAMLSGVPLQITRTPGERLVVPLIHFVLLGFLPLAAMRASAHEGFGAACGQLLAVERAAYFESGGHEGVATKAHDGLALARLFRRSGFMTDLCDLTPLATCRMYRSWRGVVTGFAKNAHEGLGSPGGIVPWSALLLLGQCAWPLALVLAPTNPALLVPAIGAAVASLGTRAVLARRYGGSRLDAVLHPLGVAVLVGIQWYALARRLAGRPVPWKRRTLRAPSASRRADAGPVSGSRRAASESLEGR